MMLLASKMMLKLVSVVVCLSMGGGQSESISSLYTQIPDLIASLCPGSNVCSSNRSSTTADDNVFSQGKVSCCAECSCSSDCSKTGNCCFPNTLSVSRVFDKKDLSCLYPMSPQPKYIHEHMYQQFKMVSSVANSSIVFPEDVSNITCGDRQIAFLGSLYPVYSKTSKLIYKNIECAREDNADDDIIIWDAVISCENLEMGIALAGMNTNTLPETCQIDFIFPGDFDVLQPFKCYSNLIDTCSWAQDFLVPEGINISKAEIRTLCTNSGIVSPYRATKMYANVFCHICNAEYFAQELSCKEFEGDKSKKGLYGGFVALIDSNFVAETRDPKKDFLPPIACSVEYEDRCRPIFCPTGQMRDRTNTCVYPNKRWYNQYYAVNINLTLENSTSVAEMMNGMHEQVFATDLPSLRSVWLKHWSIHSISYRVMDEPLVSNNFEIILHRKLSSVSPNIFIRNIGEMVGQAWSIGLRNVTAVLKSSNFSIRKWILNEELLNTAKEFSNLTEYLVIPRYKQVYRDFCVIKMEHVITKLYFCKQVELESSEFLLSHAKNVLYHIITKRFLFDGQFALVYGNALNDEVRARICIEDSGLLEKNRHSTRSAGSTFSRNFYPCYEVLGILMILVCHTPY